MVLAINSAPKLVITSWAGFAGAGSVVASLAGFAAAESVITSLAGFAGGCRPQPPSGLAAEEHHSVQGLARMDSFSRFYKTFAVRLSPLRSQSSTVLI